MTITSETKTVTDTVERLPVLGRFGRAFWCLALLLMVLVRVLWLDSDAYRRLTWSTALLTDEGFYIHNARNVVLFGRTVTDGFNNYLIMPTLHYVQIGVFRLFGVGVVQARLITVIMGLAALPLLYGAMRRCFGPTAAIVATLMLGLDHSSFLYGRLGLMDTPATLPLIAAFYFFVRGMEQADATVSGRGGVRWGYVACGLCLGIAYTIRGLSALVFPAPFLVLWLYGGIRRKHDLGGLAAGLFGVLAIYGLLWWLPHHAQLQAVNRYYIGTQLVPKSFGRFRLNATLALFGDERGLMPYLFRHTAVQFVLTLGLLFSGLASLRTAPKRVQAGVVFLVVWLLTAWLMLCVINYAPSRYYVLFYPAYAGLTAVAFTRLPEIVHHLRGRPVAAGLLCGFICYHAAEALLHQRYHAWLVVGAILGGVAAGYLAPRIPSEFAGPKRGMALFAVAWLGLNGYWTSDWLMHLTWRQKHADQWLARSLPPNSVLIGAVAPGLCMNNRFQAVNVIEDLCNDHDPVRRFAPSARYVLILDGKWKERWWVKHYPDIVTAPPIHTFNPIMRKGFSVSVFAVPDSYR